jgi:hypothetical protein
MYQVQTQFFGQWSTKAHRNNQAAARKRAIKLLQECVARRGDTRSVRVVQVSR